MTERDREPLIEQQNAQAPDANPGSTRVSRRFLLRGSGAAVATGVGAIATLQAVPAQDVIPLTPAPWTPDPVPSPPAEPPAPSLTYLRPDQAELIEAIAARIMPGDDDDPGAREAGVVYFIDRLLAGGEGFPEPTYRHPPFAMAYEGDEPPLLPVDAAPTFVWLPEDDLERYGFQSPQTPRDMYRYGLASFIRFVEAEYGGSFLDLSGDEQDEVLMALEDAEAEGFVAPTGEDFFQMLRDHTIQGMFSDPVYGGNRNLVGWEMLGYPGAQRAYTAQEMRTEGTRREPQGLTGLPHFHPGRPQQGPVLPVRGTEERFFLE
jgi:gluconate 2-dehydrogenase gamma chain